MPVEIIKYLCQFKCGTNAKSTLRQIKRHEIVCFKNPERKACSTCKFEKYFKDGDGLQTWMSRECTHDKGSSEFDELWEKCDYHSKPTIHIQPVTNCPYWQQKI